MFGSMATAAKAKEKERALPPRIDAKEAVAIAMEYFRDLFSLAAKGNIMLEEIEESEDGKHWLITLGYDDIAGSFSHVIGRARAYKRFTIDQATGRVISVKIRPVT
jgi:hypothetical protein